MRPTWAEINIGALKSNFAAVRSLVGEGVDILSVVKADGYGHGAVEVSRALAAAGTAMLGVATVDEALELREAGIDTPVLLLSGFYEDEAEVIVANRLTPAVYSLAGTVALNEAAVKAGTKLGYHLKVETGMNRLGVAPGELAETLGALQQYEALEMDGLFSHFANADLEDDEYTVGQIEGFMALLPAVTEGGFSPRCLHLSNSPAIQRYPASHLDMVRPGIMLYGAERMCLETLVPVMHLKTRVIETRRLPAGSPVSYGGTFITTRPSRIGILPIGYADGYMRGLSNRAFVSIGGQRAPVVGSVCMDLTMVDLTDLPTAGVGTEVSLFGGGGIGVEDVARWAGTISYEILSLTGKRVRKVYV